jgi:adenylylsulfate kinase
MNNREGFAVWLTGLPASGKSTISRDLARRLRELGFPVVVLESDRMRKILTPRPTYTDPERDLFYSQLVSIGRLITEAGVNVIFDATANKRAYRDEARRVIARFAEIHVDCPVGICMSRDPKGIYAAAGAGRTAAVPGIQAPYEPPLRPELVVDCQAPPEVSAAAILEKVRTLLSV